ncbi:MAG: type II toxin-antitoxin system prevent-host-death family antitoxin [Roseiarcus sp.]|jgi:prevent-host-death family protein
MWSVQEAKAKLSEIMQRALAGEVQVIGRIDQCVVISIAEYQRLKRLEEEPHPGRWLVERLRGLGEIDLPSRKDNREIPFADWSDAGERP